MSGRERRVVALYRADHVSGINATARRMSLLPSPWRALVCGPGLEGLSRRLPGFGSLEVEVATWAPDADSVAQSLAVLEGLERMGATIVVPNDIPHGFVAAGLGACVGLRAAAWVHADGMDAEELVERCGGLASSWRGVSRSNTGRAAAIGTLPAALNGELVPCPVDVAERMPQARVGVGPIRLVYAGRLERFNKRVMDLVVLCDALVAVGVGFHLSIAGRGPAEAELRAGMGAHVRAGRVELLGAVDADRMADVYAGSDALVLVSGSEGTPVVAMEAMASGRVVIATERCGGVVETIRERSCGTITPVGDMHAMAMAIGGLTRESLRAMGERAYRAARERYSIEAIAPAIDRWMEETERAPAKVDVRDRASIATNWTRILRALGAIGACSEGSLRGLATRYLGSMRAPQMAGALATWLPLERGVCERHFVRALEILLSRGARRIALYGAGAHSARLSRIIGERSEIVAIADDRAGEDGTPSRIAGVPVVGPDALDGMGVDAVLISSDEHERSMLRRAMSWREGGVCSAPVVPLYGARPTIGYSAVREAIARAPSDERGTISFEGRMGQATRRAG